MAGIVEYRQWHKIPRGFARVTEIPKRCRNRGNLIKITLIGRVNVLRAFISVHLLASVQISCTFLPRFVTKLRSSCSFVKCPRNRTGHE
jgi:hypothetical protein